MNLISAKTWPGGSERAGGVIINPENILNLHGTARVSFEMKESYSVTKNTKIKFTLTNLMPLTSKINVGLCVYEDYVETFSKASVTCAGLFQQKLTVPSNANIYPDHESLQGSLQNFALGKKTSQSSTSESSLAESPLAVDGRIGEQRLIIDAVNLNTVTETKLELQPWWQVDFGGDVLIRNLVIFKRVDEYSLSDFKVTIYDSQDNVVQEQLMPGESGDAKKIEIILPEKVEGQKLRITLTGNFPRILCLAEVQVFGFKYDFDLPIGEIFSFNEEMKVNRIGFLQDKETPEMAYVRIDGITIYEPAIIVKAEVRDFNC